MSGVWHRPWPEGPWPVWRDCRRQQAFVRTRHALRDMSGVRHRSVGSALLRAGASLLPAMTKTPVELHVVSDSTGETAARLVLAAEAQFPDQEFVEIRHPRVETVSDLQLAVDRMKGRPAVVLYTLVEPELRDTMRPLCRRPKLHYCDVLGHPIDA